MSSLALKSALPERIETARLVLRRPDRGDLDALVALADNKKLHDVLARLPHPYTRADGMGFIDLVVSDPTEAIYALIRAGEFIGVCGLTLSEDGPPELGYWLGEPFWGRGFATEGVGALLAAAFQTGLIDGVTARCMAINAVSARVLAKLGFALTEETIGSCGQHKGIRVKSFVCHRETVPA